MAFGEVVFGEAAFGEDAPTSAGSSRVSTTVATSWAVSARVAGSTALSWAVAQRLSTQSAFRAAATVAAASANPALTVPAGVIASDVALLVVTSAGTTATPITAPVGATVVQAQVNFGSGSYAIYTLTGVVAGASVVVGKVEAGTPVTVAAVWYSSALSFGTLGAATVRGSSSATITMVAAAGVGLHNLAIAIGKTSTSMGTPSGATSRAQVYYGASVGHPFTAIFEYDGAPAGKTTTTDTASASGAGLQVVVNDLYATTWNVAQRLGTTTLESWSIAQRLQVVRAEAWEVAQRALRTVVETWEVGGRAAKTASSSWSVAARVSTTVASTWEVLRRVRNGYGDEPYGEEPFGGQTLTWEVSERRTMSLATTWQGLVRVDGDATASTYEVLERRSSEVASTWDAGGRVQKVATSTWSVAQRLQTSVPSAWEVAARVGLARAVTWEVAARLTKEALESWNVASRSAGARQESWTTYTYVIAVDGSWVAIRPRGMYVEGEGVVPVRPRGEILDGELVTIKSRDILGATL